MVADFGIEATAAEGMLQLWEASGFIRVAVRSARDKKAGFEVLLGGKEIDALEHTSDIHIDGDVFD
jgi:hypothetical protein